MIVVNIRNEQTNSIKSDNAPLNKQFLCKRVNLEIEGSEELNNILSNDIKNLDDDIDEIYRNDDKQILNNPKKKLIYLIDRIVNSNYSLYRNKPNG
jgi:hypothetical protein